MVDQAIASAVKRYLSILHEHQVPASYAVLFGSCARGEEHEGSDIDVFIVSQEFGRDWQKWNRLLWELRIYGDYRIEPTPVTEDDVVNDDTSLRIEMARREGIVIY
ncbi:MAG TPA: nucleotidyltransferase domain-containing protein, partial [bacterium]|nr:nucleotidyltransferase domain-containing protein [bacterium]